jgi:nitroreductase
LDTIFDSVRWAPSWNNTQCWEIAVVRDASIKAQLQACLPGKLNPAEKAIVQAPVVLAFCGRLNHSGCYKGSPITKFGDWFMFDLGLACQNLCLTAHHLGLGTVIVGAFDHDKAAEIINIPTEHELLVLIPLGYPARVGKAPSRRAIEEFTHHDRF